ncbi:MAG: class I SAM-dependent methyltransferase [Planctomycetes bacterium]|nr:class I SAM-dependent methyltransferase [Planctomycetota bacterium]
MVDSRSRSVSSSGSGSATPGGCMVGERIGGFAKRGVGTAVRALARALPAPAAERLVLGVSSHRTRAELQRLIEALISYLSPAELRSLCVELANGTPLLEDLTQALTARGFPVGSETTTKLVALALRRAESAVAFGLWEDLRAIARTEQSTLDHVIHAYASYADVLQRLDFELEGAEVLELGPGHSLLGGVLLFLWGAARYSAVDPFPIACLEPEVFQALLDRLALPSLLGARDPAAARRAQEDMRARFERAVRFTAGGVEFDPDLLDLRQEDAAQLSHADASVDLVASTSVLEHVRDLDAVAAECARVLRPGGLALHQIDFRDHRDFAQPWAFLEHSSEAWERMHAERPFDYTNRRRLGDALAAFAKAGLELVHRDDYERAALAPERAARFAPEFRDRSQEDLEVLGSLLAYRKPSP